MTALTPVLSPHGRLALRPMEDAAGLEAAAGHRIAQAFDRGAGHGLLHLGIDEIGAALPPLFVFWREFGARYVAALCALGDGGEGQVKAPAKPEVPAPGTAELERLVAAVPPMLGAEYLTAAVLKALWRSIDRAFDAERAEARLTIEEFLTSRHSAFSLVGRVHFNLAENRADKEAPFAFLATYTTRLSAAAKAQHVPLGQALREYAGAERRDRLLSLLMPVQRAAAGCTWLKAMVDEGAIYHPLRWQPSDALRFLRAAPQFEKAGVVVRMPGAWKMSRPARPQVSAMVGGKKPSQLGLDGVLDFEMAVTLEGEKLSGAEIRRLLAQSEGLAFIRGRWVEVDGEGLSRTLREFEAIQERATTEGLSFAEAMRLVSAAAIGQGSTPERGDVVWGKTMAGPWLAGLLEELRGASGKSGVDPGKGLKGQLRPYQLAGVQWLHLLTGLGLGACLADDMGLGKTIQVLSLLLVLKKKGQAGAKPSLLVAPASLLANWAAEIARFAPSLQAVVVHPSAGGIEELKAQNGDGLAGIDLAITSYGYLTRAPFLSARNWRLVILDEAQAIKNPGAKQTREVKRLRGDSRIALTGTPIENRLGDLWSIFDFINPGLLGSAKEFTAYTKRLDGDSEANPYGPLRALVRPYVLRRMKSDRSIIADLPEKTEVKAFCPLSRRQAVLYQEAVNEMSHRIGESEGIARRGLILSLLMRLKQICNHPSQWLGDNAWAERDSGKFVRLREIVEEIAARQEKVLVFTQFREVTAPLAAHLSSVFGRDGLILHGETAVGRRRELVRTFQEDENVPFFVLSVKAGGAGLNLTAASHVVHFDRWWNPAVENQATDRAFRIGQTRNVLVHKFVCRGTVEEKIDRLIMDKEHLVGEFLGGDVNMNLTEMKNAELLRLVQLDLAAAIREG
ncbi:MAG: DEAD/DEAH box helicase [Alphaproteobacteria bacterium]|nr:DEAD/DEAH box helicase [Alphaproteobacteria bacterium]